MPEPLTKEEKSWLRKMQNLLNKCPERLGFYTVGDPVIVVYDHSKEAEIMRGFDSKEGGDFCTEVENEDAHLTTLKFVNHVHSTAG